MLITILVPLLCQKLVCNQYGFFCMSTFYVASATCAIFIILGHNSRAPACNRPSVAVPLIIRVNNVFKMFSHYAPTADKNDFNWSITHDYFFPIRKRKRSSRFLLSRTRIVSVFLPPGPRFSPRDRIGFPSSRNIYILITLYILLTP